jgi:hypothetical protein
MNSNDWCGSAPIFFENSYNAPIGRKLSVRPESVYDDFGLFLYLKAGYSLFGRTPYRDYSFIRANQVITNSKLEDSNVNFISRLVDRRTVSVEKVLELISGWIEDFERTTTGKIIVPLSGGLDSRLLISFIRDKSRIEAFTFGQSWNQAKSNEVIKAEALSKKLNFNWRHISLSGYSHNTEKWMEKWGPSCHAHGMYQMEFYSKISKLVPEGSVVLSGIIGDLLAGSLPRQNVKKPSDLLKLTLSREMNADPILEILTNGKKIDDFQKFLETEFLKYEHLLSSKRATDLITIQNKNMLLRYLVEVPEWYGLLSKSPFLDEEIGTSMLCLEEDLRVNRRWQENYLKKIGIGTLDLGRSGLFTNSLNFKELNAGLVDLTLLRTVDLVNYDEKLLDSICDPMIRMKSMRYRVFSRLVESPWSHILGRLLMRLIKSKYSAGLKMYYSYLTLIPLGNARRNAKST